MSERLSLAATQHWDGGRWAEAISLYEEIVRLDPDSPQARYDLGVACLRVGRLAQAVASLERAVELNPGFDSALSCLASAFLRQGCESEALLAYRRLSRTADDPLARRHFSAVALGMEGKHGRSRARTSPPDRSRPRAGSVARSPRRALVGTRGVRGGRATSYRGDRGFPTRLRASDRGEADDGVRPPAAGAHARPRRGA